MARARSSTKGLSRKKAREILHHGEVRGHELTEKQRKFMGARASGQPIRSGRRPVRRVRSS